MNMTVYLDFNDLSNEYKSNMGEIVARELMETYKVEGNEFLKRQWHDPAPKTWQEAFVREMAISHIMWDEYTNGDDGAIQPTSNDWNEWLTDYALDQANDKLTNAFNHISVGVEL